MSKLEYVKCPDCGSNMVLRENNTNGNLFFGCGRFPNCNGTRKYEEHNGKQFGISGSNGDCGRCIKCREYPSYGHLSSMGMCPSCQEDFDDE